MKPVVVPPAPLLPPSGAARQAQIARRLAQAEEHCRARGLRLTPLRRDVFVLLLESGRAVGAYELLDAMRAQHAGAQPPTVYRALEFLREAGLAHRIDALNAFVACALDAHDHSLLLVCPRCGKVGEINDPEIFHRLAARARASGFFLPDECLEVKAVCSDCGEEAGCCEGHPA